MEYVFDASFSAAYIMPDERYELVVKAFASLKKGDTVHVPHLWWYEMGNILRKSVQRKRQSSDKVLALIPKLQTMNVLTDPAAGSDYVEALLRLANDYTLSVYDAAYLELAARKSATLGTLDGPLKRQAIRYGLPVLES
jgi:predicted nucleic acid-binding protein